MQINELTRGTKLFQGSEKKFIKISFFLLCRPANWMQPIERSHLKSTYLCEFLFTSYNFQNSKNHLSLNEGEVEARVYQESVEYRIDKL